MALKNFNPVTPSLRGTILIDRSELHKGKPVKGLTEGKHSSGGRNNHGRITVRFRGGGHKQSYRIVDFKRRAKWNMPATVERIEYDPNRTAFIALVKYQDNEIAYIIAPQRMKVGDVVIAGDKADIKPASAPQLEEMGRYLQQNPSVAVYIVGHTDNQGKLDYNLSLSQRRAEAVVTALSTTYKVTRTRLVGKGVANLAPVASNQSDGGRAKNRRVELVLQ